MPLPHRTAVYVDGFNLYYRALKNTPYKWLNVRALAADVLGPEHSIELIRYFSAPVTGRWDRESHTRQQRYLQALRSIPEMSIHLGSFLTAIKVRELVEPLADGTTHVRILHQEEKGSDVNLATYLVHDAWSRRFDVALVFSQDTDLLEPVRVVKEELQLPVGVVVLDGKSPGKLAQSGSFSRQITSSRLAAAQFPPRVFFGRKGKSVECPAEWAIPPRPLIP